MPIPEHILRVHLHEVFGNRDADSRWDAIERIYTPDVVFHDPSGTVTGRKALAGKAQELLDSAPASFVFELIEPVYIAEDIAGLTWAFGPAGEPVARGLDILDIKDGMIASLRTVLAT
jgi:hypothetical protein